MSEAMSAGPSTFPKTGEAPRERARGNWTALPREETVYMWPADGQPLLNADIREKSLQAGYSYI